MGGWVGLAGVAKHSPVCDVWETRCRTALHQVHWERVEAMGRWVRYTVQRLNKIILLQHWWDRERSWLQLMAQEEIDKLGAREGKQGLQIL